MPRFAVGNFPGAPSSSPGSCRQCGIGRLRDGETGVVVTEIWIEMEGVIVFCEACAAEYGRLVPNARIAELESIIARQRGHNDLLEQQRDNALEVVRAQRAEMTLVAADAERANLASIEARNPGIDMEKVAEQRSTAKARRG